MISRLWNHQTFLFFFRFANQMHCKDYKSTKEKISGPDPLNHDYIRYSDIKIR